MINLIFAVALYPFSSDGFVIINLFLKEKASGLKEKGIWVERKRKRNMSGVERKIWINIWDELVQERKRLLAMEIVVWG